MPLMRTLSATAVLCSLASLSLSQAAQNRMWVIWEQKGVNDQLCTQKNHCDPVSVYVPRLMETPTTSQARGMIGALDQLAAARNLPAEHPEAPRACRNVDVDDVLGFEAESWPVSEKLAALTGLQGVFFDFTGMKGPSAYDGPFGENVHSSVVARFEAAGIPVLSEEEMENTPGKPHLNIYFSNTNPDTGCWFSVFASLTQTMLLTRNHTVKIKGGTWGFSGGYSADSPDRSEFDAIMMVVDRFITDFTTANPEGVSN